MAESDGFQIHIFPGTRVGTETSELAQSMNLRSSGSASTRSKYSFVVQTTRALQLDTPK